MFPLKYYTKHSIDTTFCQIYYYSGQTFGDKDEGGASEEEAFPTCRKETFSRGVPSTLSNSSREKTPEQPAIEITA
jgi:hypothetical protein